jgi:hypothetical protein
MYTHESAFFTHKTHLGQEWDVTQPITDERTNVRMSHAFAKDLKDEMRWVSFRQDRKYADKLWVCDDSPFPLGFIAYGNYTDAGKGSKYVVGSRVIENNKYASYSNQHWMLMSKNKDTALRNAKRYLRGWIAGEMAEGSIQDFQRARTKVVDELKGELREHKGEMSLIANTSKDNTAYDMLKRLMHHIPEDSEIYRRMQKCTELEREIGEDQSQDVTATFVCIKEPVSGHPVLHTVVIPPDVVNGGYWRAHHPNYFQSNHINTTIDGGKKADQFYHLAEFVNRLTVLEAGTYVRGVGMKISEDMFYVHTTV